MSTLEGLECSDLWWIWPGPSSIASRWLRGPSLLQCDPVGWRHFLRAVMIGKKLLSFTTYSFIRKIKDYQWYCWQFFFYKDSALRNCFEIRKYDISVRKIWYLYLKISATKLQTYPSEINGARSNVDIHEIISYSALDMTFLFVDHNSTTWKISINDYNYETSMFVNFKANLGRT